MGGINGFGGCNKGAEQDGLDLLEAQRLAQKRAEQDGLDLLEAQRLAEAIKGGGDVDLKHYIIPRDTTKPENFFIDGEFLKQIIPIIKTLPPDKQILPIITDTKSVNELPPKQ